MVRFERGVVPDARSAVLDRLGATLERRLLVPRTQLVEIDGDSSVREAVSSFEDQPQVKYAEPNLIRRLDLVPDDPSFPSLWGLENTGQTVNGTAGTADADIDAPQAWNHTTGSSAIQVAVVDSGVSYLHADLAANIWANPGESGGGLETNGVDDDGNSLIDDFRGWDFTSAGLGDNNPSDDNGHGTHVAGTIGAHGNNGVGVSGVNWDVELMPLRVCNAFGSCTSADIADAFTYAGAEGAEVVNASIGSTTFSVTESNAILNAPNTLFVVAAGNGGADGVGDDNDVIPQYPCNYTPANIVCVAATDQDDVRAGFSNFGATTVDLAAPGTNILSTYPYVSVFSDDFETPLAGRWTTGGTNNSWERSTEVFFSPSNSLADSPGAAYGNNTDSWAEIGPLDLTVGATCEARYPHLNQTATGDQLRFESSLDAILWTTRVTHVAGIYTGSTIVSLGAVSGLPTVYFRYRFTSNAAGTQDGVYIDDLLVQCRADTYAYLDGTSMASPHVAGTAGLLFAQTPADTPADVKADLLSSVDSLPGLAGMVVSGGRLNAKQALLAGDVTPPETTIDSAPPDPTNDPTADFTFSSSEPQDAEFKCRIDSNQEADFAPCTSPHATAALGQGSHTFEVRATDAAGNTDATPASHTFVVDTIAPAAPAITDTDPDSPANDNTPEVKGTVGAGSSQVEVYKNASCAGSPDATGTATTFTGTGITVSVSADSSINLSAKASDGAGNLSACSNSIAYVEDSTAPAPPALTATFPSSPANDNSPEVKGSAEPASTVTAYARAGCTGAAAAAGPATLLFGAGITVAVPADQTTLISATAADVAGNVSQCSNPLAYTEDSTGPLTTIASVAVKKRKAKVTFSSTPAGVGFLCRIDTKPAGACASPKTYKRLKPGRHTVGIVATDSLGNAGPEATKGFKVKRPPR